MPTEIEKKIESIIKNKLPGALSEQTRVHWLSFLENIDDDYFSGLWDKVVVETLAKVWTGSEVVARWCIRNPQWLKNLSDSGIANNALDYQAYYKCWLQQAPAVTDEASLYKTLRQYRNQQMLRIIWRDICGWSDLKNTVSELSSLAEVCINVALSYYAQPGSDFSREFGLPYDDSNGEQALIVIAMGKLGARELNLSSDIDLIFAYGMDGKTNGGEKNIENLEYFVRLGKKLISALNNTTEDGFVFRVDMRLRPFGDGGALVSSLNSLENYYQIHGREWERYAMIKARIVSGKQAVADELMQMLRPFVYRRYMDYGAYESMRELKTMIAQQVKRKGMQGNVKLGAGGIREIEFIGQVFQLIRGGRDVRYQRRELLEVLKIVKTDQRLPDYVVDELVEAYIFLRNTEHRLQAVRDQQTHQLPESEIDQIRLAYSMGFDDWENFISQLDRHRSKVHAFFEQVFDAPHAESKSDNSIARQIWHEQLSDDTLVRELTTLGYQEPDKIIKILKDLRNSKAFHTRTTHGQNRLNQLMPMVIGAVGQVDNTATTLQRIIEIIEQVAKRSVYMSLLIENPLALSQLVRLCEQSSWVSHYISRHPLLLDDLLDPRSLYVPATKKLLIEECYKKIEDLNQHDDEQIADAIRHFKQSNVLRIAAADLAKAVSLMRISDYLSWLAEVVLDVSLQQAWQYMVQRYGKPVCADNNEVFEKGFAVIAYGKLGGYELGYGSDLDMVFLHATHSDQDMTVLEEITDSPVKARSVPNSVFYMRLGQRLIHLLSTRTAAGRLYEVDLRLRPDGASGMLVSSVKAYEKYQHNKAWVWEHQALVRARAICGEPAIMQQFNTIRKSVLTRQRDLEYLKTEVVSMREKMRRSLSKDNAKQFDIKQGKGGLVDIEFIVQFGVLAWANEYPELCEHTDNISLLHVLHTVGKLSVEDSDKLTNAYKKYRQRIHRLALQDQKGFVRAEKYTSYRDDVKLVWNRIFIG